MLLTVWLTHRLTIPKSISWSSDFLGCFQTPTTNSLILQTPTGYPTIQLNSNINSNSIQFWHKLPGVSTNPIGSGLSPTRLPPTPLQIPAASPRPNDYKSGVPRTPLIQLDNLLEWLTDFREMLNLHLSVYGKEYNSRTARWKRYVEQGMEVCGAFMPSLGALSFQRFIVFTSLEAHQIFVQEFL